MNAEYTLRFTRKNPSRGGYKSNLKLQACIGFALLLLCGRSALALTRQQAETIVSNQVIASSPYNATLVAYSFDPPGPDEMLAPGEVLMPFDESVTNVITEPTWFFWLDYTPSAWFVHPAAFVLVADASSAVTVIDVEWWPNLNGDNLYSSYAERTTSPDIFFGNPFPPTPPATAALLLAAEEEDVASLPAATGSKWAIAVSGPTSHPAANADLASMSNAWRRLGVPADNIKFAKGTKKAFCDQIDALKNQDPPCDKLFFHWTGHGNKDTLYFGHPFNAKSEKLTWCQLADKLKSTKSKSFCESIESCKGGGGKAILKRKVGGDGVTATDEFTDADYTTNGSHFTSAFADCLTSNWPSYAEALKWAKAQSTIVSNQNPKSWGLVPQLSLDVTESNTLEIALFSDAPALCSLQTKFALTNEFWMDQLLVPLLEDPALISLPVPPEPEGFIRAETLLGIDSPPIMAFPDEFDGSLFFSVTPFGLEPFDFQWLINGQPLPGEVQDQLMLPFPPPYEATNVISVIVGNPAGQIESLPVPLMHEPLEMLHAEGQGLQMMLEFNLPLDPASAEDPVNYVLFGELSPPFIQSAQLLPDQMHVQVQLAPPALQPGFPYFIQAPGVHDLDGQPVSNGQEFLAD